MAETIYNRPYLLMGEQLPFPFNRYGTGLGGPEKSV